MVVVSKENLPFFKSMIFINMDTVVSESNSAERKIFLQEKPFWLTSMENRSPFLILMINIMPLMIHVPMPAAHFQRERSKERP